MAAKGCVRSIAVRTHVWADRRYQIESDVNSHIHLVVLVRMSNVSPGVVFSKRCLSTVEIVQGNGAKKAQLSLRSAAARLADASL